MEIEKIQTKKQAIEEIKKLQARVNNLLAIIDLERKEHAKLEKVFLDQSFVTAKFVLRELRLRIQTLCDCPVICAVSRITYDLEKEYLIRENKVGVKCSLRFRKKD